MPVSFVAASTALLATNTTSAISVPKPIGTASGHVLVAFLAIPNPNVTFTLPTGWVQIGTQTDAVRMTTLAAYKVAGASEPDSYAFTPSLSVAFTALCLAYSGVNPSPVISSSQRISALPSSANPTNPVTVLENGSAIVSAYMFGSIGSAAITLPVGTFHRTGRAGQTLLTGDPGIGTVVADQPITVGSTTPVSYVASSAVTADPVASHVVALRQANVAPNAPTPLYPTGNVSIDRAVTNRFSWSTTDPNTNDTQSQYDLRYRVVNTTPWTTLNEVTVAQFRDIAGSTFAAGAYEWQVRTYDSGGLVGAYSASALFSAVTAPSGPTITSPTNGQVIGANSHLVTWSAGAQDAYQVRTVADAASAPDTSIVYVDTAEVTSATARSHLISFPTNSRFEHVQVRVKVGALWSSWASARVQVSYTPPATPSAVVFADTPKGAITVYPVNPTPSGSQPAVVRNMIYRQNIIVAAGVTTYSARKSLASVTGTAGHVDWSVGSVADPRNDYLYTIVAVAANGVTSEASAITVTDTGPVPNLGANFSVVYGETFILRATISTAGSGLGAPPYTYAFSQVSGVPVSITPNGAAATVTAPAAAGAPGTPTGHVVTAGETQMTNTFTAPASTGAGLTDYEIEYEVS